VQYAKGPFAIGARLQYLPSLDTAPGTATTVFGVDSHQQLDLFGNWRFGDRWQLRYGINNVTDEDPEWVGSSTTNHAIGTTNNMYDQIGRQFFVGATMTL
jgi:outer membrane receptor protein involved in Fe transport